MVSILLIKNITYTVQCVMMDQINWGHQKPHDGCLHGALGGHGIWMRKNFDLISLIKTSGIGGEPYKALNYADMESHGIDLLIGGTVIKGRNWNWKSNFIFGYNTTKITHAKNLPQIFDLVKPEGGNME